jgi:hypothetical protein
VKRAIVAVAVVTMVVVPLSADAAEAKRTNFWFTCTMSHVAADDPIIFPDQPGASHLHEFSGNTSTDAFSTYDEMVGGDTSCNVPEDSAGYWIPQLTLAGEPVAVTHYTIYYWGILGKTTPFPADLRIVAGATVGRPTGTNGVNKVGWGCGHGGPTYAAPPDCGSVPFRAHVVFPSCWDGVNLDAPDHHSHMAYGPRGKSCPSSHPVMLPRLAFHVTYAVTNGAGARLSSDHSDDRGGSTLHADFWNTWVQSELERLVATCINQLNRCKNMGG